MPFLNREQAQKENDLLQAEEDRQAALTARNAKWHQKVCDAIGVSVETARPVKILIEIDANDLGPVVTVICKPEIDLEKVLPADALADAPINTEYSSGGHDAS
jgi:hypothetical protein